ncbi:glycosyltransferase family 4 protein [Providencia huaxiensis]|uniref:glycosyltransferase family 4 protein n=1 Tax=Providencia huaxiensis TaxID=2027290 RepID=UPI0034E60CD4
MKKICFFIANINGFGGTERVTSIISNELSKKDYEVHILSLHNGLTPFFHLSKNIISSQLSNKKTNILSLPLTILKLNSYLKNNKIDILITVESMLFLYSLPATLNLKIKNICWEHFNYNVTLGKKSRHLARKLAARYANNVITLTNGDKKLWKESTKCNAKLQTIYNPITIDKPKEINLNKEKILLAVGRLTHQKGFDLLLKSWKKVSLEANDWTLKIVGEGEDNKKLRDLIKGLDIKNVELHSKTKNISSYYQEASFFVMSSRFEGFGLVLAEAQSYGLPAVSFDCPMGPSEIIEHNQSGWLCEPENINSLASTMLTAINSKKNINIYKLLSDNSIKNAENFTLERIINHWESLINE